MARTRLSWDAMFMQIAAALGARSSCLHYQIGCVSVDDLHRIITVGYNGSPRGEVNCTEAGCAKEGLEPVTGRPRRCRGAHDVTNALLNCRHPEDLRGAALYATTFPCYDCMKTLVQAGVRQVIYRDEYLRRLAAEGIASEAREPEPEAWELARRMDLEIFRYDPAADTRTRLTASGPPL